MLGPNANRSGQAPLEPNFGRLTIDWKARALAMEVQMLDGSIAIAHRVGFSELERQQRA
jgi:alkaline phosphatase D